MTTETAKPTRAAGGSTLRQRGRTGGASSGGAVRRTGGTGASAGGLWKFYSEDSTGIKIGPVPVLYGLPGTGKKTRITPWEKQGLSHVLKIHAKQMSVERDIRYDLLARLCSTGAEIRSVCTEAGMFAIRARRKVATEKDFLEAVNKVDKGYAKFSAAPRYPIHD